MSDTPEVYEEFKPQRRGQYQKDKRATMRRVITQAVRHKAGDKFQRVLTLPKITTPTDDPEIWLKRASHELVVCELMSGTFRKCFCTEYQQEVLYDYTRTDGGRTSEVNGEMYRERFGVCLACGFADLPELLKYRSRKGAKRRA